MNRKILPIVITFGVILLTVTIIFQVLLIYTKENRIDKLENDKTVLDNRLENAHSTIKQQKYIETLNEHYNKVIKDIVRSIASRDKQYGIGGVDANSPAYTNSEALSAILKEIENRAPNEWINNVGKFFEDREEFFRDVPDIWPIKRKDLGRITSGFGVRVSPVTGNYHSHNGVDISSERGTEVIATADGKVIGVWRHHPTFGKIVYIEHKNGFETRYAHLDSIDVKYKQEIVKGNVIGKVGDTGKSKGVHLHYEIRKNEQPMDPVKFWLLYY